MPITYRIHDLNQFEVKDYTALQKGDIYCNAVQILIRAVNETQQSVGTMPLAGIDACVFGREYPASQVVVLGSGLSLNVEPLSEVYGAISRPKNMHGSLMLTSEGYAFACSANGTVGTIDAAGIFLSLKGGMGFNDYRWVMLMPHWRISWLDQYGEPVLVVENLPDAE